MTDQDAIPGPEPDRAAATRAESPSARKPRGLAAAPRAVGCPDQGETASWAYQAASSQAGVAAPAFLDTPRRVAEATPTGSSLGFTTWDDPSSADGPRPDPPTRPAARDPATPPPSGTPFPGPGEVVGGFRLIKELGRGAFARVFLAEQVDLGRRPVALKVSRAEGDEPEIMARLQHTHIVPIYSAHDDPATGLRLLCMPYLGGANLARMIQAAGPRRAATAPGPSFVDLLDAVGEGESPAELGPQAAPAVSPPAASGPPAEGPPRGPWAWARLHWPGRGIAAGRPTGRRGGDPGGEPDPRDVARPARQFLRRASPVRAAAWVVARLAEGLDHAHQRGLLHRDLKPSNVLIAADGTPMLLDFNLSTPCRAADPACGDEPAARAVLGGSLPYMAPEHLDAIHPEGATPPEAVDARSDLYALGLVLFELLTGEPAFAEPAGDRPLAEVVRRMAEERSRAAPSPRAACPAVPWGLDALVRKCLDPDPARRYARARDLAEDLRRFLSDHPLRHAPEPCARERLARWARRYPRKAIAAPLGVASGLLIAGLGLASWYVPSRARSSSRPPAAGHGARLPARTSNRSGSSSRAATPTDPGPGPGRPSA